MLNFLNGFFVRSKKILLTVEHHLECSRGPSPAQDLDAISLFIEAALAALKQREHQIGVDGPLGGAMRRARASGVGAAVSSEDVWGMARSSALLSPHDDGENVVDGSSSSVSSAGSLSHWRPLSPWADSARQHQQQHHHHHQQADSAPQHPLHLHPRHEDSALPHYHPRHHTCHNSHQATIALRHPHPNNNHNHNHHHHPHNHHRRREQHADVDATTMTSTGEDKDATPSDAVDEASLNSVASIQALRERRPSDLDLATLSRLVGVVAYPHDPRAQARALAVLSTVLSHGSRTQFDVLGTGNVVGAVRNLLYDHGDQRNIQANGLAFLVRLLHRSAQQRARGASLLRLSTSTSGGTAPWEHSTSTLWVVRATLMSTTRHPNSEVVQVNGIVLLGQVFPQCVHAWARREELSALVVAVVNVVAKAMDDFSEAPQLQQGALFLLCIVAGSGDRHRLAVVASGAPVLSVAAARRFPERPVVVRYCLQLFKVRAPLFNVKHQLLLKECTLLGHFNIFQSHSSLLRCA